MGSKGHTHLAERYKSTKMQSRLTMKFENLVYRSKIFHIHRHKRLPEAIHPKEGNGTKSMWVHRASDWLKMWQIKYYLAA